MDTSFSRRDFLKYTSLAALAPVVPAWARPTNPDVIIVGAGASGIAAARRLAQLGWSTLVLEAADRIGGRVHTDFSTFGVPFDIGAHWLAHGDRNPLRQYGINHGFTIYADAGNSSLFVDGELAKAQDYVAYRQSYNQAVQALERAGAAGTDVAASEVVPGVNDWDFTSEMFLGSLDMGQDFPDFSTLDWYYSFGGGNAFCAEGYGSVVAHYAKGVSVELNSPVDQITWRPNGVEVKTSRGTLHAKAVIVTVSLGVLASGRIQFDPVLPYAIQSALENMTMGVYNHIALMFANDVLGEPQDHYIEYQAHSLEGFGFVGNISGSRLAYADVGGSFARNLELEAPEVAIDMALSELVGIFGSDVRKSFVGGSVTKWGQNPNTMGSWATTAPGHFSARAKLRNHASIADRIFLAGEAFHPTFWGNVDGAALSGRHPAEQVNAVLNGGAYQALPAPPKPSTIELEQLRTHTFGPARPHYVLGNCFV